jgi:hypothetical protein
MLVFLDKAVREARYLFSQPNWKLFFGGRETPITIADMHAKQYEVGVGEEERYYTIRKWQALNSKNYEEYQSLDGLLEKARFLEKKLANHIISFATGIDYRFEKRFDLEIVKILDARFIPFKGFHTLTFDIRFKTNAILPPFIGLGKGVSQGMGVVFPYRKRSNPSVTPKNPF